MVHLFLSRINQITFLKMILFTGLLSCYLRLLHRNSFIYWCNWYCIIGRSHYDWTKCWERQSQRTWSGIVGSLGSQQAQVLHKPLLSPNLIEIYMPRPGVSVPAEPTAVNPPSLMELAEAPGLPSVPSEETAPVPRATVGRGVAALQHLRSEG